MGALTVAVLDGATVGDAVLDGDALAAALGVTLLADDTPLVDAGVLAIGPPGPLLLAAGPLSEAASVCEVFEQPPPNTKQASNTVIRNGYEDAVWLAMA
ncbi:MAG: hypothetical protein H6718_10240 [Polyangiaceae bacterium]|nr:hypothetical protein [Polyangiaceae bacterium]MCB9607301.1 hypothetical protein [Polyangiaceae bacterium]